MMEASMLSLPLFLIRSILLGKKTYPQVDGAGYLDWNLSRGSEPYRNAG